MSYRLLLDTSSLMYRAFYALPQSMIDKDGHPINAVHGYLDMAARLQNDYRPDELVHVYDADWRPAGRTDIYPPYKGDRPEEPETLVPQFDLLRRVLEAAGQTSAEAPHWEADDAIGTLCQQGQPDDSFDIVTGDRDLLQLVKDKNVDNPTVRVLYTVRGVTQLAVFDEAAVMGKYGVPSDRYVDFAILRGDPSDGLPGVKGIGEKTATKLVQAYPSLDALMQDLDNQKPKMAQNLRAAHEYIGKMYSIVPVRHDVTIDVNRPQRDDAELAHLADHYRLGGPLGRLGM